MKAVRTCMSQDTRRRLALLIGSLSRAKQGGVSLLFSMTVQITRCDHKMFENIFIREDMEEKAMAKLSYPDMFHCIS